MVFKSNGIFTAGPSSNVNVNGRNRIRNQGMANGNTVKMNGTTGNAANPPRQATESSEDDRKADEAKRRGSTSQTQAGNNGQARHRPSRAGTRCVSKLSAAQLARKRANDREAQRAIRQRTKDHIENLERRIEELSDPSKELKIVWEMQQRNRELEEEVRVLKQRMASMQMQNAALTSTSGLGMTMGMGQEPTQNLNNMQWPMEMGFNDTDALAGFGTQTLGVPKQERPGPAPGMTTSFSSSDGLLSPYASESPTGPSFPDLDTGGIDFGAPIAGTTDDLGLGSDLTTQRSWTTQSPFDIKDSSMFSPPEPYIPPSNIPPSNIPPNNMAYTFAAPPSQPQQKQQQPQQQQIRPRAPSQAQRQPQPQPQQQQQQPQARQPPRQQQQPQPQGGVPLQTSIPLQPTPTLPAWAQTPRFLPSTSMIDSLLQDALQLHRSSVLSGSPNPSTPDYASLLSLPSTSPSPLSAAINRAIQLAGFKPLAVQAAVLYTTHALLRWQTNPLPDTYAHVPAWLRPGKRQIETPHPLWVAQLVWPGLRERVVSDLGRYATEEFAFCYARCLGVEWEGVGEGGRGFEEGIFEIGRGGEIGLTRGFEETVREGGKWRLGGEFVRRWPELGEVVRVVEEE